MLEAPIVRQQAERLCYGWDQRAGEGYGKRLQYSRPSLARGVVEVRAGEGVAAVAVPTRTSTQDRNERANNA